MRTIIDLPQDQIDQMAALGEKESLSRAELVRRAVADYLQRHRAKAGDDDAFGLWKDKPVDGLALQQTLRAEWDE